MMLSTFCSIVCSTLSFSSGATLLFMLSLTLSFFVSSADFFIPSVTLLLVFLDTVLNIFSGTLLYILSYTLSLILCSTFLYIFLLTHLFIFSRAVRLLVLLPHNLTVFFLLPFLEAFEQIFPALQNLLGYFVKPFHFLLTKFFEILEKSSTGKTDQRQQKCGANPHCDMC